MRHLIVVLTLALLAVGMIAGPVTAVGDVSDTVNIRLPGGNNAPAPLSLRFSQATFTQVDTVAEVLLATEATFADALASGTLQGEDTPLLLTSPDDLRADISGEIDRLDPQQVTILGGTAALDASVEEELTDLGIDVDRVAGGSRIETAIEIAELAPEEGTALVARGYAAGGDDTQAFADALAAGAWAAEEGWATFLTQTDMLTPATRQAIADSDIDRVLLLGGEAALSPQVQTDLEALGVDVDRIAGPNRFDTATAIAGARGFDSAADADRIILVEGQADDAWAAGFAAAAHGALHDAPIVLANGDELPPATSAFLTGASAPQQGQVVDDAFTVDADDVTDPVLICVASAVACDRARAQLGLPQEAQLTLDEPADGVPSRDVLTGSIDLFDEPASVAVFGDCVTDGLVVPDDDGSFELPVQGRPGVCTLEFEISFDNGTVQRVRRPILVAAATPQTGPVTDTETGGDAYTLAPEDADDVLAVTYEADDSFLVDGQAATIGAFEASITVADQVTFRADTADGTVHELTNVDPATITTGTVGQVNLATDTFAIIEPLSGVVLRGGLTIEDGLDYQIGIRAADRAEFEADINEGDRITATATDRTLVNRDVIGMASDISIDAVSGIARFRVGGLGDDPLNAEDERFRAVAGDDSKRYVVDGEDTDFDGFVAGFTEGDRIVYERVEGVEHFVLTNSAPPPVEGLVTETSDPDGSPVAPEPDDGGTITLLTPDGRQAISYTADAEFRIDRRVATEAEFEAARTPGDEVTHQVGDASTGTAQVIALVNRDLTGDLADITEGANTLDVVVLAGVVYDDLDYSSGVFGGADLYLINGDTVGLAQFENELALIDRGEVRGTLLVRAAGGNTEHRLTSEDLEG